ncbi:MAG TPA: aromatic-ring-hydroxylating dioxygenase subunit beta [Xanthobacteraceae bacterium]|jgi:benzoate/toluate 1,2-dioxygenase beta subunit|nr:aromatic-ring-hydroxylating dioxygenase subunit beta [Xanthobacteraceae bacterium]
MARKLKRARKPAAVRRRRPLPASARMARLPSRPALDLRHCEQFLLQEARLLDDGKFDDWLALFTADAWYWVPSEPDQTDRFETVSLISDDKRLLETRVRRLASPRMYSQEPRSRTSRIVTNVTLEESSAQSCTLRSKFLMIEYRREQQRLFGGTALHGLVQQDGRIMIAWKRIDLVNCDAPLDGITIPF